MEQQYLQDLVKLAKQKLKIYHFNVQNFEMINILLFKQTLERENSHLFIRLKHTSRLYLPFVTASFIFLYEKNYCEQSTSNFDIGDIIYDKKDKRSYYIEEKTEGGYKLKYEDKRVSECTRSIPYSYFETNNFIKVFSYKKHDFTDLLKFLNTHLGVNEILAGFQYKIAIVCYKQELINDLRKTAWYKAIPYCYLTKDGKEENNFIEPLIYIASDYQTIREHLFDKGKKVEVVMFFEKYNETEIIRKDIREGQLKKAIFIGEDELEFEHSNLLKWRWSAEEFNYFDQHKIDFSLAKITPIYAENSLLRHAIDRFIADIEEIEQQYTVQFLSLKFFARKTLFTIYPENDSLPIDLLKEKFTNECDEILFNELYAVGTNKKDIDIYSETFQNNFQDILEQIQFKKNKKFQELASIDFEYLVVSSEHKENWKQFLNDKTVLTYSEWKRNKGKNKKILFLGLHGYSHYQAMKDSCDTISILMYADSHEQQNFEYYERAYLFELDNEYHSKDRKTLSGLSYPQVERVSKPEFNKFNLIDIEQYDDNLYQREEILLKFIFEDNSSEILPINRHILISQGDKLINEVLANVKIDDTIGVYHNSNKDKLEDIATEQQKQAILECKKYVELWKKPLIDFYRSNNCTIENLLCDLKNNGADINHINTLNKWLDMNDKTLFPSKKNMMAIKKLVNNATLDEKIKEIGQQSTLYRSITIALGRDFSDAISHYILNQEKTSLLKKFSSEQIDKILKENFNFKKVIKIAEPNTKEKLEVNSLDSSSVEINETNQPPTEEKTMTNEEFQVLLQESTELAKEAQNQADSLNKLGASALELDIQGRLSAAISDNEQLKQQLEEIKNKIDVLGGMQKKHNEAIRYLLDSFNTLNTKVDNLRISLK